jgi:GNAT superfamily N-acetyltransferase
MTNERASPPGSSRRTVLPDGLVVGSTEAGHADQLAALQLETFPTLADEERFKADHYRHHVAMFPAGQFVVLDGDRVVAATSTIRRNFDFDHPHHTFAEIIQGGWLSSHKPEGRWLYGCDLSVHPDYRGRGLARALYAARHHLVHALGLEGQLTAGMISGYGAVRDQISPEGYFAEVCDGRRIDPTLSMQLAIGFEARCLLPDHLHDPISANYSVLIVLPRTTAVREPATTPDQRAKRWASSI